jgi:ribonuclease HII
MQMEDSKYLNPEDKKKLEDLIKELAQLKAEHKSFAAKKGGVSPEEREKWRLNSQRTNQVNIEIKNLRFKNVIEAAKG